MTTVISPQQLLQALLRYDTTNPPGNEAPALRYLQDLLKSACVASQLVAKDTGRPNLIARLPGNGRLPGNRGAS